MSRCRWNIWEPDQAIHYDLPGCMGGAVYGPGGCTCRSARERADLENRVDQLERMVRDLTSIIPSTKAEPQ